MYVSVKFKENAFGFGFWKKGRNIEENADLGPNFKDLHKNIRAFFFKLVNDGFVFRINLTSYYKIQNPRLFDRHISVCTLKFDTSHTASILLLFI